MSRLPRFFLPAVWIFLCSSLAPLRAATISLQPPTQDVAPGDSFFLTLEIAGAGQILTGYDVTLGFDPALVAFNSRTFLNALGVPVLDTLPTTIVGSDTVQVGEIALIPDVSIPVQGNPLSLFTLQFTALAPGLATFTLSAPSPFSGETPLGQPFPNPIEIEAADGAAVDIAEFVAVPEPGTMALVASGFAAMLLWRRIAKSPGAIS